MSQRCFLEVYSKHTELKDENQVKYWERYIELIEPILSEIKNPNNGPIMREKIEKIKELLPEFKDSRYALTYYSKVNNDYFAFNNQLCFKYFVPDAFLMPFKKGQVKYSYKEDFDPMNEQFSGARLKYTTTVKEGISLMEKRIIDLKESEFKTGCNQVLEFLKGMPLDSILVLNSGDIYIEESPEYMLEEIKRTEEMFDNMDNR